MVTAFFTTASYASSDSDRNNFRAMCTGTNYDNIIILLY